MTSRALLFGLVLIAMLCLLAGSVASQIVVADYVNQDPLTMRYDYTKISLGPEHTQCRLILDYTTKTPRDFRCFISNQMVVRIRISNP